MGSSAVPNPSPCGSCLNHAEQKMKWQRIFESQDVENGHFDVTFNVEDKKLHAHKIFLSSHSEIFKAMFSTRWLAPNVPIQIANRTFDDFKTFLSSMYFAPLHLTSDTLMTMVDMSEYYGAQRIKDECDVWLSTQEEFSPLLDVYEAVKRYSLLKSKTGIFSYIIENFLGTSETARDLDIPKEMIMDMVTSQRSYLSEETVFKAVYYWAANKHQHLDNSSEALHQALKIELADILTQMKFKNMSPNFFNAFISSKKDIFDDDSWKAIKHMLAKSQVVFTFKGNPRYTRGDTLSKLRGYIFAEEKIVDSIKSLKDKTLSSYFDRSSGGYWSTRCKKPSKPSQLKFKENVPYYLCITGKHSRIAVKKSAFLDDDDYLLAELYGAGHSFNRLCQISVM